MTFLQAGTIFLRVPMVTWASDTFCIKIAFDESPLPTQ